MMSTVYSIPHNRIAVRQDDAPEGARFSVFRTRLLRSRLLGVEQSLRRSSSPVNSHVLGVSRSGSRNCSRRGSACPASGIGDRERCTSSTGPSRTSRSFGSSESTSRTGSPGCRQAALARRCGFPLACSATHSAAPRLRTSRSGRFNAFLRVDLTNCTNCPAS